MIWRRAAFIFLIQCFVWAEKPSLDGLFPLGLTRGTTNSLTVFGRVDPWPPRIWCENGGVTFQCETNKGKVVAIVSAEAEPGPALLRLLNDEGASEPRIVVIGDEEDSEREPNNHYARAQVLTNLPATVNGRLEKNGDVDSYRFEVRAGEWIDARLDCYTLFGKVDAVLRLLDTNGFQLEWNHDFETLDPRLVWRSPVDQKVVLQVFGFAYPANAQIELSGGSGGSYRLRVGVSSTNPVAGSAETGCDLVIGRAMEGALSKPGERREYRLIAKKDQWFELRVSATELGSPMDPWVSVVDAAGKQLARNDDAEGSRNAVLDWKAPDDGEYQVHVGSVTTSVREGFRYLLTAKELKPDFVATVAENAFVVKVGETNQVKVKVNRLRGFTNELSLALVGLPDGFTDGPQIDVKGGEVTMPLVARTNWQGTFRVEVSHGEEKRVVPFELLSRTVDNGVPGGYIKLCRDRLEDLCLTVLPKKD